MEIQSYRSCQQIFTDYLLCIEHDTGCQNVVINETDVVPPGD